MKNFLTTQRKIENNNVSNLGNMKDLIDAEECPFFIHKSYRLILNSPLNISVLNKYTYDLC